MTFLRQCFSTEYGISEKTVKDHRGRIMGKLRLDSVADLVRLAEKAGIKHTKG